MMASSQVRAPVAAFAHAGYALALPVPGAMEPTPAKSPAVETTSGSTEACAEAGPCMEGKGPRDTTMVETMPIGRATRHRRLRRGERMPSVSHGIRRDP